MNRFTSRIILLLSFVVCSFFALKFVLPVTTKAQDAPGYDKVGPKVVVLNPGNLDIAREEYDKANPGNVGGKFPATFIISTDDVKPEHIEETKVFLKHAKELNIEVIPRASSIAGLEGWATPSLGEAKRQGKAIASLCAETGACGTTYAYNELNLPEESADNNPVTAGKLVAAFAEGFYEGDPGGDLFIPPFAGKQGGAEYEFMRTMLDQTVSNGQTLAQYIADHNGGAALTIYGENAQDMAQQYKEAVDFYRSYGINRFGISELGPLKNGQLLQSAGQVQEWVNIMQEVFTILRTENANFFEGAEFINTSFFVDTDGDGFPNETWLVIIGEDGTITINKEIYKHGGYIGEFTKIIMTCNNNPEPEPGSFRPAACEDCGGEIKDPTHSCAETYRVEQDTLFYIHEGDGPHGWDEDKSEVKACSDDREDQQNVAYFERDWGGRTTIDISNTVVPFAGFRDKPPQNQEAKYQARYFTGSWISEGPSKDFLDEANRETFYYYRDLESGVMNKILSPRELDRLRCDKIKDAIGGKDEDYLIPHEFNPYLYEKDSSEPWEGGAKTAASFRLTEFGNHAPPCQLLRLKPPEKATAEEWDIYSQEYQRIHQEYLVWLNTDQARLWPYIPLTTLKDAPGKMILQIQKKPGRLTTTTYQLSFPHLATLYQSSKILYDNLTPKWGPSSAAPVLGENTTQENSDAYLEGLLEESNSFCGYQEEMKNSRILLAQSPPEDSVEPENYNTVFIEPEKVDLQNMLLHYGVRIFQNGPHSGHQWLNKQDIGGGEPGEHGFYLSSQDPVWNEKAIPPTKINPDGTFQISVHVESPFARNHPEWGYIEGSTVTCSGTVDLETGEILETTCGPSTPAQTQPKNYCKNPDQFTPGACKKEDALTDTNPDLDLICSSPYPIEPGVIVDQYHATFTQNQLSKILADLNKCIDDCKSKYPDDSSERGTCYEKCRWQQYGDYNPLIVYRMIGIDLHIPYLEAIGHKLIGENEITYGLFDIFRPPLMPRFEEKPAKSNLGYKYVGNASQSNVGEIVSMTDKKREEIEKREADLIRDTGTAEPSGGNFYYPWLGGVEEAKQCVSTVLLQPGVTLDQVRASRFCPTIEETIDENYEGGQGPYF